MNNLGNMVLMTTNNQKQWLTNEIIA